MRPRAAPAIAVIMLLGLLVALTGVVVLPTPAHATAGEVLMDCTRDGDEYLFDFSQPGAAVTAWVTDAAGSTVGIAQTESVFGRWVVKVPAAATYETVWASDGTTELSLPRASPDCNAVNVSVSTDDLGPGLTSIAPRRLYDTRATNGRLRPGTTIAVTAAGRLGIPADATAVMANIVAVGPSDRGHLTAFPCGQSRPDTAVATYVAGENRAGASLIGLDASGKLCIFSYAESDIVVDIQGYVANSANPVTVTPTRLLDTRVTGSAIDGLHVLRVTGLNSLGLPFDAGAFGENVAGVWLNVSAFSAEAPGHLTVYGGLNNKGSSTARLNYEVGRTQTNLVYTPVLGGKIFIDTSSRTDVTVDVVAVSRFPNRLVPITDFRLLDTRSGDNPTADGVMQGTGRLSPNAPLAVPVAGRLGALSPTEVLLNLAIVNPSATTHVTVYPCGTPPPTVSSANAVQGAVVPNAVLVPVGVAGTICVVSPVATDIVIDLEAVATIKPVGLYYATCVIDYLRSGDVVAGGKPPYTVTGTLPEGFSVINVGGSFIVVKPDSMPVVLATELVVTDANGRTLRLDVDQSWAIVSAPRPPC